MLELLGLVFILIAFAYGIWALISPFVVISLNNRVAELERELRVQRGKQPLKSLDQARHEPYLRSVPPGVGSPSVPSAPVPPSPAPIKPAVTPLAAASRTESNPPPRMTPPTMPVSPTPREFVSRELPSQPVEKKFFQPPVVPPLPPAPTIEPIPVPTPPPVIPKPLPVAPVPVAAPVPVVAATTATPSKPAPTAANNDDEPSTLEEILAGKWLTWVGALAVIIGAGFGFKYAIENHYIGPRERVLIGIVTGLACFVGGAYAMGRKYRFLGQGLTGAALGILYLSLYAAFGWYGILSYETAFLGMILTTTLGLSFAGYFNVQPTAVLGMLGGFLTPAMLWPDHDPMWTLFPYLLMLDLGVLLIAGVRRWAGLEILAFCGTLIIWFNWHRQFYDAKHLTVTIGYMTAFMALFAFLSVWHNVIRRRKASAADFFLILATPTAYFATLYALTFEQLPQWQGEFALLMMAFYASLAALAALWHPAGKSVIAALSGVAATFLILAVPLELTGHWVTICWICQAVLLVELGLYFREKALLWTGLTLLAKIQVILLVYFLGTLADPIHFQTAFVRIQLHLIERPETPLDTAQAWWSVINGRSLSYLADVIGFAILSWEFSRRRNDPELKNFLPQNPIWQLWLNITVPIVALAMIVAETFGWGVIWKWDAASVVSAWTIWTALFACGSILWSRAFRARGLEGLGWLFFLLLACFVSFTSLDALRFMGLGEIIPLHRLHALWLLNPRGIGLLTVIFAGGLVSLIYQLYPSRELDAGRPGRVLTSEQLACWFGSCAYGLGLALVLLETRVWSVNHQWLTTTTLAAGVTWTTIFMLGAITWRVVRQAAWVQGLIYATLALTEFFLACLALLTIEALSIPELAPYTIGNWWLINPRGIGFLIATVGCLIGAVICRRIPRTAAPGSQHITLRGILELSAFLTGLVMVWLETLAWGIVLGWDQTAIASVWTIWTAPFACGAVYWSTITGSRRLEALGWSLWLVLASLIGFNTLEALRLAHLSNAVPFHRLQDLWLLNPRGISFLTVILAGGLASYIYRTFLRRNAEGEWAIPNQFYQSLSKVFAGGMYFLGLELVLLETWVWAAHHQWLPTTAISACAGWASLFMVAAVICRVERAAIWVESLVMTTFGVLCALLIPNTFLLLKSLNANETTASLDWWLLNPHGGGYLAAVAGCALGALWYRRVQAGGQTTNHMGQGTQLGIASYVLGLGTVLLETAAWGYPHGWLMGTLFASSAIWMAVFLVGLVAWSARQRTADFDTLVGIVFCGLVFTLLLLGGGSMDSVTNGEPQSQRAFRIAVEDWCLNPRFIAFLVSVIATGVSASLYRGPNRKWKFLNAIDGGGKERSLNLSSSFAIAAYLAGVALFSLEVFVQGTSRDWMTATSLGITLVWTTYATLTLIGGIYWKSGWVRAFSLCLLVITVGKVFLFDVWHLATVIRVFAFISLGISLLLVSFLYRRYRKRIRSWIAPSPSTTDSPVV